MKAPCSHCQKEIADDYPITVIWGKDLNLFCDIKCRSIWFSPNSPASEGKVDNLTPKNPFCRRSGLDRRTRKERRTSVDLAKFFVDRRGNGPDRRKRQDRRKCDL
jgi:hypothetical protein